MVSMTKVRATKYWLAGLALGLLGCGDPGSGIEGDGGPNVFTVERVMHCRQNNILCNDVISRDEYRVWEQQGDPSSQRT
jgi:hypothetical protein